MTEQEQQIYAELLVIRCQQGDEEAFQLLVKRWQKPLLLFALRYLDQEADAWDAVQETWVAVIKGLSKLQSASLFVSWLFRILTNKCIDRIRHQQSEARQLEHAHTTCDSSDLSNDSELLTRAIQRLSAKHRTLILLRFGHGLKIARIGAMLNMAEGTVKSKLHRALARLRDMLGETT